jgi:hypothetical protein
MISHHDRSKPHHPKRPFFTHTIVMDIVDGPLVKFAYTTNGDIDLEHKRKIGYGGFGDVHEVCPQCGGFLT